jgi:nucleoside-diphosphate-sugar epimerase
MWFAEALAQHGHTVVAAIRGEKSAYSGLRAERLGRVVACCEPVWNMVFGSSRFLDAIARAGRFDVFCHHAAAVAGYKSPAFDAVAATATNTRSAREVLKALRDAGCGRIVLTGSIFEEGEGAGSAPLRAFSSYGLSKSLTAMTFAFHAAQEGMALGKFVIPNPFGPYEEPRFTEYLVQNWRDGKMPCVGWPRYVRDNIHVSLLAAIYARFAQTLPATGFYRINPSGYIETQGAFASRFAREIGSRLMVETPLEFEGQTTFPEPSVRVNTDVAVEIERDWNECAAWDGLADYYACRFELRRR